jgi:hypothetical protein
MCEKNRSRGHTRSSKVGCGHFSQVMPSKILSVVPITNGDPPSVSIEVLCSLCDEVDILVLNLLKPADGLSWLRKNDFYFVCGRHRKWEGN